MLDNLVQKLMKVKATDKFSFPLNIDLGPYQSPDSKQQDAVSQVYDLQAILIHKGSSASQGHYGIVYISSILIYNVYIHIYPMYYTNHLVYITICIYIVSSFMYVTPYTLNYVSGGLPLALPTVSVIVVI